MAKLTIDDREIEVFGLFRSPGPLACAGGTASETDAEQQRCQGCGDPARGPLIAARRVVWCH